MRSVFFYILLTHCFLAQSQDVMKLKFVGNELSNTKNKSFVNNTYIFLEGKDTLKLNIKLPYDSENREVVNRGFYRNCLLKEGEEYEIRLKKICLDKIPFAYHSYYRSNTKLDSTDCSHFLEYQSDTDFKYQGNYGMYVDFDNYLYQVVSLYPSEGCSLRE